MRLQRQYEIKKKKNNPQKPKSLFCEKINKTDKPVARFSIEKSQISSIRNEIREATMNTTEIQGFVREYYEELCIKLNNLKEINS